MYVRRRIRVNPPVRHKQRPPSHPRPGSCRKRSGQDDLGETTRGARPGSCRNGRAGPVWEIPPVVQVTDAAAITGLAHPGTRRRATRVPARTLTPCQPGECSWSADARSTSCASPALPVVSAPGTRRSSAPDRRVDARPVGGHVAAVAIPAGSTGHHRRADKGEVAETGASKANPT